ncbi:MAG TPA: DUF5991 domain-containing protein [Pyrinomonadaceae bacterium]
MMKIKRLVLATVLCAFATVAVEGQSVWAGRYEHTANLGRTAGGTGIVVSYAITILPDNTATIQANGYQTDDEILCEVRERGNKASLYFKSYPNGGELNQFGVQLYKKGDFILSLERINSRRFRVRWGKYNTELTKSVVFVKVKSQQP